VDCVDDLDDKGERLVVIELVEERDTFPEGVPVKDDVDEEDVEGCADSDALLDADADADADAETDCKADPEIVAVFVPVRVTLCVFKGVDV
jgi:hypothetical protein